MVQRIGPAADWTAGVRRSVGYALGALAICAACAGFYRQLWPSYAAFNHGIDSRCGELYCDFSRYYFKQARAIRTSDRPIYGYYYSPTFALLLAPIARLSIGNAWQVWSWVQALSLGLLLAASARALRDFPAWVHALGLALTLTSFPVLTNWRWGQLNSLYVALAVLALLLHERAAFKRAGFALSWVIALRYYPAIYALGFVTRRGWVALVWCALFVAGLLVLIPALAMGPDHAWRFYSASATSLQLATHQWFGSDRASAYLPNVVNRMALKRYLPLGSVALWITLSTALAAASLASAVAIVNGRSSQRALWAFCFLALSTPLLVATCWMHYFVYLPLAQTFLGAQLARASGLSKPKLASSMLLWISSIVLASVFFFLGAGGAIRYERQAYLLWSDLALLALAHLLWWSGVATVELRDPSSSPSRSRA